jgi:hypothetical protein
LKGRPSPARHIEPNTFPLSAKRSHARSTGGPALAGRDLPPKKDAEALALHPRQWRPSPHGLSWRRAVTEGSRSSCACDKRALAVSVDATGRPGFAHVGVQDVQAAVCAGVRRRQVAWLKVRPPPREGRGGSLRVSSSAEPPSSACERSVGLGAQWLVARDSAFTAQVGLGQRHQGHQHHPGSMHPCTPIARRPRCRCPYHTRAHAHALACTPPFMPPLTPPGALDSW